MVGDPIGRDYIPYIGIRGEGRCCNRLYYRWRTIGGPVAWNEWQNAFVVNCPGPINPPAQNPMIGTTTYRFDGNRGRFLYGEFEALTDITSNVRADLWLRGSWLDIYGDGTINSIAPVNFTYLVGEGTKTATDSRYVQSWYAYGMSLEVAF